MMKKIEGLETMMNGKQYKKRRKKKQQQSSTAKLESGGSDGPVANMGVNKASLLVVVLVFGFVVLWRFWMLSSKIDISIDMNILTYSSVSRKEEPISREAPTVNRKIKPSILEEELENLHKVRKDRSKFLMENDVKLPEGSQVIEDEDQDEYDEVEEAHFPVSRRVTVLLGKDFFKSVQEKDASMQAYLKTQERFMRSNKQTSKTGKRKHVKNTLVEKHFLKGHWFDGRKFFVYQPSGGMSNQRMILEWALLIAKRLNRVLVVPPVAPHTSMFWNYNGVDWIRTAEAFDVFSKDRMEQAVPVLGLSNTILRRFVEANENKNGQTWFRVQRDKDPQVRGGLWTLSDIELMFKNVTEDVLFFAQTTMWKSFDFSMDEVEYAQQYVQLAPEFRTIARIAVDKMFKGMPFNSAHIRFKDKHTEVISDVLSPPRTFLYRLNKKGVTAISNVIYIATQPSKITDPFFAPFRKAGYDLVFSNSLVNITEVSQFLQKFPDNDIQDSILGLVEQLVCTRGAFFLGTGFSTFSRYIRVKRNNPVLSFDESLLPEAYRYDNHFLASASNEEITAAFNDARPQRTKQRNPVSFANEVALVNRPPLCDRAIVSLRIC